jgi:sulfonate transport system ATP-binding protein
MTVDLRTVVARGVRRRFGDRVVLDGIDLEIGRDEFMALLGRSGTGKTTLLRAMAGLDADYEGSIQVPAARSVVFQEPRLLPWRRVLANVVLGLGRGEGVRRQGADALAEVGLADHADAWPATLSGGEAQRVALARALVREPALLLLDEPFGALDALTRLRMHALLRELCRRHQPAVLLVTHDVDEAIVLADRVAVLDGGRIVLDRRVSLDHPRDRADPVFAEIRADLLGALGVAAHA